MLQFLGMKEWRERITEEYVYIAETDHLLLADIPNRATPKVNVAFFFPYMSPVPAEQAAVVKRYFAGDHLSVQPVGPSPAIVHVDALKKLTPLWYDLSVELKHDNAADRAFGWVLEMWGSAHSHEPYDPNHTRNPDPDPDSRGGGEQPARSPPARPHPLHLPPLTTT